MVVLNLNNYILLFFTFKSVCIISHVGEARGINVFSKNSDWRIRKLVKRASADVHEFSNTAKHFSTPNETATLSADDLFNKGSFWYVYDAMGMPWKIIHKEKYLVVPGADYVQSEDLKWYKVMHPSIDFKIYFDSLPTESMFNNTIYLFDNARLQCKGDKWSVKDGKGDERAILLQGDNSSSDLHIYHVKCDNDEWYKFKNPPEKFVKFLSKVVPYKSQLICDKLIRQINTCWWVPNSNSILKKIMYKNSRREKSSFTYACGEDGLWYMFLSPPRKFINYLTTLPVKFRYDRNDLLVKTSDSLAWVVPNEFNKSLIELNVRQEQEDDEGLPVMHVRDAEGTWFMFLNPPEEFQSWCNQLPMVRHKKKQISRSHRSPVVLHLKNQTNYQLLQNGTDWLVQNDKGQLKRIVLQGDQRFMKDGIYYVRCDDFTWYKFIDPPKEFIMHISALPVITATPVSDKLLLEKNSSWYIFNKRESKEGKIIFQASLFIPQKDKYHYGRDEFGCWYKFFVPPAGFLTYLHELPYFVKISDNSRLKYSNETKQWMVVGKKGGKLKKLVEKEKSQHALKRKGTLCIRSEEGLWYTFIKPPQEALQWLVQLPDSEGDVEDKFDNFRLAKRNDSEEWLLKDDEGKLRKMILRSDKWYTYSFRNIYFVMCDDLKWYRFIRPPKEFLEYTGKLPVNQLTPLSDDVIRKIEKKWFVINKLGKLKKVVCRGKKSGSLFTYARDEDDVWYKFLNPNEDFKLYLDSLPCLEYNTDNDRLFPVGDDWFVQSKRTGKPIKLTYRHLLVGYKPNMTYYMARDEQGLWYKFYNPPEKFKLWLYKLPPCEKKNIFNWDNYRLVQNDTKWSIKDDNGTLRRILQQGDSRLHSQQTVHVRCDDDVWYKLSQPPESFLVFISMLSQQSLSRLDDNSLIKLDDTWAVINKIGIKSKIIPNLYQVDSPLYKFARDENGFWHKLKNPPEDFFKFMLKFPASLKTYGRSEVRVVANNMCQVCRKDDGQWKDLKYKIKSKHEAPGFCLREACDDTVEWYTFINPTMAFKKCLQQLPTWGGKWFRFGWDNLRLLKKGGEWKVKDDLNILRDIVLKCRNENSNSSQYKVLCNDHKWYRFKYPPESFIKYLMKLNVPKANSSW